MVGALVLLLLAVPASASAYVYWTNGAQGFGTTLGRAGLDGGGVDQGFIEGAAGPEGIAVEAPYVYWTNSSAHTIGRALLDGSDVDQDFIETGTIDTGIAVGAGHIYWSDVIGEKIGRANLDGSGAEGAFISTASSPEGIALDGSHIYWANALTPAVGRAELDGSEVEQSFIAPANLVGGIAVGGGHIYWATGTHDTIARADLDGGNVEEDFVSGGHFLIGIAIDDSHLYWSNRETGTLGRANLDGSEANQAFIEGASAPVGIAVDSLPLATTMALSCTPASAVLPATTDCTATVSDGGLGASADAGTPTGTVSFAGSKGGSFAGGPSCALVATGPGAAGCRVAFAPVAVGSQAVSGSYPGDGDYGPSAATAELVVGARGAAAAGLPGTSTGPPSDRFRLARGRLNRMKGTATIRATVPGPGWLVLSGKRVRRVVREAAGAGTVKLLVRAKKADARKLRRTGRRRLGLAGGLHAERRRSGPKAPDGRSAPGSSGLPARTSILLRRLWAWIGLRQNPRFRVPQPFGLRRGFEARRGR